MTNGCVHLLEFRFWSLLAMTPIVFFPQMAHAQGVQTDAQQNSEHVTYIVKRGDTLIGLAEKYFRKPSDYRVVQRINRIKNPRLISVGKRLSVPFRLLKYRPSTASIAAFKGNVSLAGNGQTADVSKGMALAEGQRISTAASSFVTLKLEDGSRISMPSNSRVRVERLRHIFLTDSIDYEFSIENGRIRSKIVPFSKKADRYRVRTPVAVSAVRGTDYRTRVDEASGTVFSETVEGLVDVSLGVNSGGKSVSIPEGTGAAATVTGSLDKADLLSPPTLVEPGKVQSEQQVSFAVTPRADAAGNRILVSTDAGFVDIVAEQQSESAIVSLPSLPDGRYFAKATSISNDGFEGMPAAYSFKRQLSTLSGSAGTGDFGYRFKWDGEGSGKRFYRFQIVKDSKSAVPMVDEAGLIDESLTLSDLPDGEYYWRIGVTQISDGEASEKWTDFEKLTVAG